MEKHSDSYSFREGDIFGDCEILFAEFLINNFVLEEWKRL